MEYCLSLLGIQYHLTPAVDGRQLSPASLQERGVVMLPQFEEPVQCTVTMDTVAALFIAVPRPRTHLRRNRMFPVPLRGVAAGGRLQPRHRPRAGGRHQVQSYRNTQETFPCSVQVRALLYWQAGGAVGGAAGDPRAVGPGLSRQEDPPQRQGGLAGGLQV